MPSKTLMVRKAVYDQLNKEKHQGESFSRLMERLLARRRGLKSCYGLWGSRAQAKPAPGRKGE
jgi:predicted CopG family antitoxin